MIKIVLKRFAKGFIAGGLAQLALIVQGGLAIRNLEDAQNVFFILLTGFIVGGLLGLEKAIKFQP